MSAATHPFPKGHDTNGRVVGILHFCRSRSPDTAFWEITPLTPIPVSSPEPQSAGTSSGRTSRFAVSCATVWSGRCPRPVSAFCAPPRRSRLKATLDPGADGDAKKTLDREVNASAILSQEEKRELQAAAKTKRGICDDA